jgi:hypothetical protein
VDEIQRGEVGRAWIAFEIDAAVAAYLRMLSKERRGELYTKVEEVRQLADLLPARSRVAIERKFMNISAILDEIGLPWIDGYKPYRNYQEDLRIAVLDALGERRVGEAFEQYGASALVAPQQQQLTTDDVLVPPPAASRSRARDSTVHLTVGPIAALKDFQSKAVGDAGEEWVLELERKALERHGRSDLSRQVVWVAHDVGDGAGYDIASFHPDGRERLIEVKTTNYGIRTPFYITRWEVEFSVRRAEAFSLYRVHGFNRDPKIYVLDGSMREKARLEPHVFLGLPA